MSEKRRGRPPGSKNGPMLVPSNVISDGRRPNVGETSAPPTLRQQDNLKEGKRKRESQRHIDNDVGPSLAFFPFTKLPQNRAVLQRYMWYRENNKSMSRDCIVGQIATELLQLLWGPSGLPTLTRKHCKVKVARVIERFIAYKKHRDRNTSGVMQEFQDFLSQLCDLSAKDILEKLKRRSRIQTEWEEDWHWYQQMCSKEQPGLLVGRDMVMAKRVRDKQKRTERANQGCCEPSSSSQGPDHLDSTDEEVESDDHSEAWEEASQNPQRKRTRMPPEVSNTFDRLQLSFRDRAMVTAHTHPQAQIFVMLRCQRAPCTVTQKKQGSTKPKRSSKILPCHPTQSYTSTQS